MISFDFGNSLFIRSNNSLLYNFEWSIETTDGKKFPMLKRDQAGFIVGKNCFDIFAETINNVSCYYWQDLFKTYSFGVNIDNLHKRPVLMINGELYTVLERNLLNAKKITPKCFIRHIADQKDLKIYMEYFIGFSFNDKNIYISNDGINLKISGLDGGSISKVGTYKIDD